MSPGADEPVESHQSNSGSCSIPRAPLGRIRSRRSGFAPHRAGRVSEILKLANRAGIPVVPRAGGTGLNDGAVPLRGGIIVDVKRMDQIKEIDLADRCVTVGPRNQHDEAQRRVEQIRCVPSRYAGVLSLFAGRRTDRVQRILVAGYPIRTLPRPGDLV